MERRAARAERWNNRSGVALVVAFAVFVLGFMFSTYSLIEQRDSLLKANQRLAESVLEQDQVATDSIPGSAMVEVGVPTEIDTPLGKLLVTSQLVKADPPVKAKIKFVNGGKTRDLEMTGRWWTDIKTGWEFQADPEGFWLISDVGEDRRITGQHKVFTVQWRKDPDWRPLPPRPVQVVN
jgi:hypothetical protein